MKNPVVLVVYQCSKQKGKNTAFKTILLIKYTFFSFFFKNNGWWYWAEKWRKYVTVLHLVMYFNFFLLY